MLSLKIGYNIFIKIDSSRNYFDVYASTLERDDATSELDDVFFEKEIDNHVHFSADTFRTPKTSQDDVSNIKFISFSLNFIVKYIILFLYV